MAPEGTPEQGSDRSLVLAFKGGDEEAYELIFKRYHARVHGICRRMLGTPADADEAAQETFLKAYQALPRFNGSFYLGAWLSRIATNVCVDHIRSRARTNLVALPDDRDDLITQEGPEEIVVGDHPRLENAIRSIQPLHASALALRTLEGLSHEEIAGHLRMTPPQVKALLHRARNSLRKAWDKAEGWAWAPLLSLRSVMNDRATADAGRLASVSPSAAPFLMERVAASAMIVAAALSGLPTTPDATGSVPAGRAPSSAAPFDENIARGEAASTVSAAGNPADTDLPPQAEAESPDLVERVTELALDIDKTLRDRERSEEPASKPHEEQSSPVGPSSAEGKKLVKQVGETAGGALEEIAP